MNKRMREIMSQIENLNEEAVVLYEAKDFDAAGKKVEEIENLEKEYKLAEKLFNEKKTTVDDNVIVKSKEEKKIANFANGIKKVANSMSEGSNTDGGYTVPEDIQTDIEHLRESKESLQDLVSVESVSTNSGRRTFKKRSQMTGFSKVGEGSKIGINKTPQYSTMEYKIDKYAGIYPATNELLEDSDANIYNELTVWIADESRVTRNALILEIIRSKSETILNGLDDIKKALNVTLGAAFKATSRIVTNDDGLQYLDTLKDSDGKYLLQKSPSDPMNLVLCAGATTIPVKVYANDTIPSLNTYKASTDTTVTAGKTYYTKSDNVYTAVASPTGNPSTSSYYEVNGTKIPMTIGDLKEGIKLFDRKKTNIMTSNVAVAGTGNDAINAFDEDLTLFRAIEREDVVMRDDKAFVNGYINIAATTPQA